MRLLVLGAGALGGYFGARAMQAGLDVTFLVRPRRAAQLARDGLVVESPLGDARLPARILDHAGPGPADGAGAGHADGAGAGHDVVLLACKAWDLDAAIAAIRPAVEGGAAVLPVLNGMAHLAALDAAFGPARVWGGLAKIQATLTADGRVRHLNDWRQLVFGERDGRMDGRAAALAAALRPAPGLEAQAVPDIDRRMWEKLVHLGTVAGATVLHRASVGEIVRGGGRDWMLELLARNAAIAAAHGHVMDDAVLAGYRAMLSDPASAYTASLLRDLEAGGPTEGEHILGWLLEAARRAGVPDDMHRAAALHIRAHGQRRAAGRLPGAG